ncbi:MAG: DUF2505 domain-containing protein [Gammaproteobacteria bacterium]|nr:DUF2505 domain-containing protein [Gammaproteobacteria bacterium]
MKVTASHKYDASVEQVYAAFCKADFYKKKFVAVGARNTEVLEKKKRGDEFYIRTRREMPSEAPGVLQKFLGEWNTIEQTETWEADDEGFFNELEIESPGVPVSIEGSMSLQPSGKGCVNKLTFDVTCSIPFVGGKLEEFIARDMKKVIAEEYKFVKSYLKG